MSWLVVLAAAASATELVVMHKDGPKECDAAHKVRRGDNITMHYIGTIDESSATGVKGKQFDTQFAPGKDAFETPIGVGMVIQGWDKGLIGLCQGTKFTLVVPPALGIPDVFAGPDTPKGATLNFDMELLSVKKPPLELDMFVGIDANGDGRLSHQELLADVQKRNASLTELPPGLLKREDKDGDGYVTWEEFSGPKGLRPYKVEL